MLYIRMIPVNEPKADMKSAMVLDIRGSNKFSKKSDWLLATLETTIVIYNRLFGFNYNTIFQEETFNTIIEIATVQLCIKYNFIR